MADANSSAGSGKFVLTGIGILIAGYLAALFFGLPQQATRMIVAAESEHKNPEQMEEKALVDHHFNASSKETGTAAPIIQPPPLWMVLPFALMLGIVALFPLLHWTEHWWESNLHRFYVSAVLAVATLVYFFLIHNQPVESHWPAHHIVTPGETGPNYALAWNVLASAILKEYVPFITLLFSLFVISGGIRVEGDLRAHSLTNAVFLLIGGLLASFIGTTGAAMILIRPLLETNSERKHVVHTVIFFIFVVCNCGGCLLPLGDPPLFLGYLLGVPFLYTISLWKEWLFINGLLIVIYFCWDHFWFYPHEAIPDVIRDEALTRPLKISGVWLNGFLLLGVMLSVALLSPGKTLPGADWHPWFYLREIAQLILVAISLYFGDRAARRNNNFNYAAIIEVAALFFGIFITMQPALQMLAAWGPNLGLTKPWHFFWATGILSSVLDNAPTYVVFFTAAQSLTAKLGLHLPVAGVSEPLLAAISMGAVFMGANTYIGNGPNFMVKAIAEQSGLKMPGFFGYMLYSGAILIPIFILTTFLFL